MIRTINPNSSHIKQVTYDTDLEELKVTYKNDREYLFTSVPESVFDDMSRVESVGSFLNKCVYEKFNYIRVK